MPHSLLLSIVLFFLYYCICCNTPTTTSAAATDNSLHQTILQRIQSLSNTKSTIKSKFTPTSRTSYILQILTSTNAWITNPVDRRTKFAALKKDPHTFLRGTNVLYWLDFGTNSEFLNVFDYFNLGIAERNVAICADLHVENFGVFVDSTGTTRFSITDFDDSLNTNFQHDLYRVAISLYLAMEQSGISPDSVATVIDGLISTYLQELNNLHSNNPSVPTYYDVNNVPSEIITTLINKVASTPADVGKPFDMSNPNYAPVSPSVSDYIIHNGTLDYASRLSLGGSVSSQFFTVKSIAKRLNAGTGSLGSDRYYILIEGPTSSSKDDIVLDLKSQRDPSAFMNVNDNDKNEVLLDYGGNNVVRVFSQTKLMDSKFDKYLGYMHNRFTVRQKNRPKGDLDYASLITVEQFVQVAKVMGAVIAHAHWNSNPSFADHIYDEIITPTGKANELFQVVNEVGKVGSEQVKLDYQSFVNLCNSGQLVC
jgi:uncharacterized protein (DUF2252 family)